MKTSVVTFSYWGEGEGRIVSGMIRRRLEGTWETVFTELGFLSVVAGGVCFSNGRVEKTRCCSYRLGSSS